MLSLFNSIGNFARNYNFFSHYYGRFEQRRRQHVWDGGKTIRWFGGRESPSGIQGQSLVRELGDKVPQKVKNFKSSYKQILRNFGSISHIFTYISLFFCACRHHSTKSAKWWGHLIPFAKCTTSLFVLSASGAGATAPPPGSAAVIF